MTKTKKEIAVLEERLRHVRGPARDNAVLVDQSGTPALAKRKVVEAHRAGEGAKFTAVEMSNMHIREHGSVVVVTCTGNSCGWQIVAGSIHQ